MRIARFAQQEWTVLAAVVPSDNVPDIPCQGRPDLRPETITIKICQEYHSSLQRGRGPELDSAVIHGRRASVNGGPGMLDSITFYGNTQMPVWLRELVDSEISQISHELAFAGR